MTGDNHSDTGLSLRRCCLNYCVSMSMSLEIILIVFTLLQFQLLNIIHSL